MRSSSDRGAAEFFLAILDAPDNLVVRWSYMLGGILLMALGSALYLAGASWQLARAWGDGGA